MKLLAWNLNHRAKRRRIPEWVIPSLLAVKPHVIILTEYVVGLDHDRLCDDLQLAGFTEPVLTQRPLSQNQVLIAAREPVWPMDIDLGMPADNHPAIPSNISPVYLSESRVHLVGFRMPSFKGAGKRERKRIVWDWLVDAADRLRHVPALIVGDFNTAPTDPPKECGDGFGQLQAVGWHHPQPPTGYSWKHPRFATERRIDHLVHSSLLAAAGAQYVWLPDEVTRAPSPLKVCRPDHAMLMVDVSTRVRPS